MSIYLIVDNYSRYILNWVLHPSVCGKTMTNLLRESISIYKPKNALLLVDGGPENNNKQVDDLLENHPGILSKLVAQRDISFSNSMVEAVNKIIKNNYLRMMDITSVDSLNQALEFAIHDYNNVRPHYSLEGATPYAMFMGQPCDKLKIQEQMREARIARRRENNANICDSCK